MEMETEIESILERAAELEEKGERYIDGDKSLRFYMQASHQYLLAESKVSPLIESGSKDEAIQDIVYNCGRILFVIAEFKNPPQEDETIQGFLDKSIQKFKKLLQMNPLHIDALFNLAQALHSQIELISHDLSRSALIDSLFQESLSYFRLVYNLQSELLLNKENQKDYTIIETNIQDMDIENDITHKNEISHSILLDTLFANIMLYCTLIETKDSTEILNHEQECNSLLEQAQQLLVLNQHSPQEQHELSLHKVSFYSSSIQSILSFVSDSSSISIKIHCPLIQRATHLSNLAIQILDGLDQTVQVYCEKGDIYTYLAELQTNQYKILNDPAYLKEARLLYEQAANAFIYATRLESKDAISLKLGDIYLIQIKYQSDAIVRATLAKLSITHYMKACQRMFRMNYIPVYNELVFLVRLYKAYSWIQTEEKEMQKKCLKLVSIHEKRLGRRVLDDEEYISNQ